MDQVEQVRERTDIVSLIGESVSLKKAGKNFKANCPFHSENSPSFFVSPDRQMFHCFGCQKGGDVFTFLMEYEHMEFPEALRTLAKKAGITLIEQGQQGVTISKKERLYKINALAAEFYHYLLMSHPAGKNAREYVTARKINEKVVKTFKLGFAPSRGTALTDYLIKKKSINPSELVEVGLGIQARSGFIDFFRGRLMFPLVDHRDNIVGFSGRILDDGQNGPKYINTRDTLIYHKGEQFYGIHTAKDAMRKENAVVLVEGEFDVISSFQEGITHTVAIKGTALTERQAVLLKRYIERVILCLDEDDAGQNAMVRSLPILEKQGLHISAVVLPGGKDPADALSANPGEYKRALKADVPIYDYLLERMLQKQNPKTVNGKAAITDFMLPLLSNISNEVVKEHYLRKLSTLLDTTYESMQKELDKRAKKQIDDKVFVPRAVRRPRDELMEEYLLALIVQSENPYSSFTTASDIFMSNMPHDRSSQKLFYQLKEYFNQNDSFNANEFGRQLPTELLESYNKASLHPLTVFKDESAVLTEIRKVSFDLREKLLRKKLQDVLKRIKLEENEDNVSSLREELDDITHKLQKNRL